MDLRDEIVAAHGVAVAQTALLTALLGVLRQRGVLNDDLMNVITDAAVTQVETAPGIDPEMAMRARQILELISQELARPPQA